MSAPFAPGDVVVCVDDRPDRPYQSHVLRKGKFYRVETLGRTRLTQRAALNVGLRNYDGSIAWFVLQRFRKIDDEVTEDFRTQLKSISKPKERV